MDDSLRVEVCTNGKIFGGRKYPNALKDDIKRKLSFINKKISDLHHQRRFAYKNSVKVKKVVHNQINQIVKCLRAREQNVWSNVDEAYISQDASISDELSKLQSVHGRCKVLFNHLDDFKGNKKIFSKIQNLLAEVNFERSNSKPLEFISEFEAMKIRASNYGHLEGDFFKKDDFVVIDDKKHNCLSDAIFTQFIEKEEYCEQTVAVSNIDYANASNCLDKFSAPKEEPEVEDSFQIVDLLDNMRCHDDNEDYIMCEEESQNCDLQTDNEFDVASTCEIQNNSAKLCESSKYPFEVSRRNFNLEEEWRRILETNKKLADFKKMMESEEENKFICDIHSDVGEQKTKDNLSSCKKQKFLLLKEADDWLCNLSSRKRKNFKNTNFETNLISPAELIQKAFEPYLSKDNVRNWLSCE